MKNKMKAWLYESPAILILVIAFFGSIYAGVKGLIQYKFATPLLILIILVLFFIGKYYENKHDFF